MKKIIIAVSLLILSILSFLLINNTFAIEENNPAINPYFIYYQDNSNKLNRDLTTYIETLDDILIPISSFDFSPILVENYNFLVDFAIRYIADHQKYYQDKITIYNDHSFTYNGISTNKYIDLALIYEITDIFFAKRDFYIINNNVENYQNKISLLVKRSTTFKAKINQIKDLTLKDDLLSLKVYYDDNSTYKYYFKILTDKRLVIYNVELVEDEI